MKKLQKALSMTLVAALVLAQAGASGHALAATLTIQDGFGGVDVGGNDSEGPGEYFELPSDSPTNPTDTVDLPSDNQGGGSDNAGGSGSGDSGSGSGDSGSGTGGTTVDNPGSGTGGADTPTPVTDPTNPPTNTTPETPEKTDPGNITPTTPTDPEQGENAGSNDTTQPGEQVDEGGEKAGTGSDGTGEKAGDESGGKSGTGDQGGEKSENGGGESSGEKSEGSGGKSGESGEKTDSESSTEAPANTSGGTTGGGASSPVTTIYGGGGYSGYASAGYAPVVEESTTTANTEEATKNAAPAVDSTKATTTATTTKATAKLSPAIEMNSKIKAAEKNGKFAITWGAVTGASYYEVYAQYCGSDFVKSSMAKVTATSAVFTVSPEKQLKAVVKAYDAKDKLLGTSIQVHVAGSKTDYTNAKSITLDETSRVLEVGGTATIKATTNLASTKKKVLSDAHAKEFRYQTSDKTVATVSSKGKITAKAVGKCTIYVYSRNGYAKTVTVRVIAAE
ncbi:Ig-like domain-containing protein [Candidatus Saccharibacteria bacterium]|nr:Ig-like domain-containing protein [Candidatus Saccharibacteria bacterium]